MTNKEEDGDPCRESSLAALLAVHLVSQVLDEAYIIANAAYDSGQAWRHMSIFENFKSGIYSETDEDVSFAASKGDIDVVNENKMEHVANIVATSTPQKVTGEVKKPKPDAGFIGQGDEDLEMQQNELTKSTSMFLNHLFDMSEVETVIICDDADLVPTVPEPTNLSTQAMTKIMESYINSALGMAYDQNAELNYAEVPIDTPSQEHSDYSFLADAFAVDIGRDVAFYIHDDAADKNDFKPSQMLDSVEITELKELDPEVCDIKNDVARCEHAYLAMNREIINTFPSNYDQCSGGDADPILRENDVARYEQAYLTMNRDYDQYSEDDADPILQDPKGMTLQEVELLTANTSDDNVTLNQDPEELAECEKPKELTAISGVSAASSSKKSTLVHRCRIQGARLLACLRGWWRRKTPGKRREARLPGSVRGLCPLSPDARRRAASLMDHRLLRSPSPSRSVTWKFNTVNEALVNSSHWKEYSFESKPDESGEYKF